MAPAHSAASEHPPAQIVPPQAFGAQSTVSAFGQAPLPSQLAARVATAAVQAAARHDCVVPGYVQTARLAPSHVPPQGVPAPVHVGWAGRGAPITETHCPFMSGSPHASQAPSHALSQQTPSTQKPEAHSPPTEHAAPSSVLGGLPVSGWPPVSGESAVSSETAMSTGLPSSIAMASTGPPSAVIPESMLRPSLPEGASTEGASTPTSAAPSRPWPWLRFPLHAGTSPTKTKIPSTRVVIAAIYSGRPAEF